MRGADKGFEKVKTSGGGQKRMETLEQEEERRRCMNKQQRRWDGEQRKHKEARKLSGPSRKPEASVSSQRGRQPVVPVLVHDLLA